MGSRLQCQPAQQGQNSENMLHPPNLTTSNSPLPLASPATPSLFAVCGWWGLFHPCTPGTLLQIQSLCPPLHSPDLLNQHLHFSQLPWRFTCTFSFGELGSGGPFSTWAAFSPHLSPLAAPPQVSGASAQKLGKSRRGMSMLLFLSLLLAAEKALPGSAPLALQLGGGGDSVAGTPGDPTGSSCRCLSPGQQLDSCLGQCRAPGPSSCAPVRGQGKV